METSLFLKTIIILSSQIGIIFIGAYLIIRKLRKATLEGSTWMGTKLVEAYNSKGELDLLPVKKRDPDTGKIITDYFVIGFSLLSGKKVPVVLTPEQLEEAEKDTITGEPIFWVATKESRDLQEGKKYEIISSEQVETPFWFWTSFWFWGPILLVTSIMSGLGFGGVSFGLPLMTAASLLFAPILAWILILMDENDGIRIMWLTLSITLISGIIGTTSGLDFSFLQGRLFIGLFGLLVFRIYQLLNGFSETKTRMMAIFGCVLFTLYLLYDFNRLSRLNEIAEANNWDVAFHMAYALYLDIINLLLELLEAMGQ